MYTGEGRLLWHRSQAFDDLQAMRRAVREVLIGTGRPAGGVTWMITQGDISLAAVWERVAMREGVRVQRVSSDVWQARLLAADQCRTGPGARRATTSLAREVIAYSGAPAGRSSDSAPAILIGLWGAMTLGWLPGVVAPPPARRTSVLRRAAAS